MTPYEIRHNPIHLVTLSMLTKLQSRPTFNNADLQEMFDINCKDAYSRISKLHAWGLIRKLNSEEMQEYKGHNVGRVYTLTDYGKRFVIEGDKHGNEDEEETTA